MRRLFLNSIKKIRQSKSEKKINENVKRKTWIVILDEIKRSMHYGKGRKNGRVGFKQNSALGFTFLFKLINKNLKKILNDCLTILKITKYKLFE